MTARIRVEDDGHFRSEEKKKEPVGSVRVQYWLLLLFVALAYVPFLHLRMIRPAGDDKVYVAQAMEMERAGTWFVQTLADEPDYRKGPFHYIALRLGYMVFGNSMWATLWMNFALVLLGAWAVAQVTGRHLGGDPSWAFWSGMAFGVSAGVYSHVFASQMEVELAALFAVALYFLDRLPATGREDWKFWLLAGLIGTVKAPLHSVLIAGTAFLLWWFDGSWRARMRSPLAWLGLVSGVLFAILAYAPILLLDLQNFINTFLGRENFDKGSNGAPWHYPIIPFFTYFLFPWTLVLFVAYAYGLLHFYRRVRGWIQARAINVVFTSGHERLVILGFCLMAPSILFFLFHGYRGQNYHLPVIAGLVFWLAALWSQAEGRGWQRAYAAALALTGLIILLVPIALTILVSRFRPMPEWWSDWTLPLVWIGVVLGAKAFLEEALLFSATRPAAIARKSLWFFLGAGVLLVNLGEREMVDLRQHYARVVEAAPKIRYGYYNLHRNVWSEWAYLNFWAHVPVYGVHTSDGLKRAALAGDYILVPGEARRQEFEAALAAALPGATYTFTPWARWHTKAKNEQGEPVWKEAWRTRQLKLLERTHLIVKIQVP